jgi:PIN domain nuclease of toxin-antitoxin system
LFGDFGEGTHEKAWSLFTNNYYRKTLLSSSFNKLVTYIIVPIVLDSTTSNAFDISRRAIKAGNNINFVSIASLWVMAIKVSMGKLELKTPFNQVDRQIEENGFEVLPITFEKDTLIVST